MNHIPQDNMLDEVRDLMIRVKDQFDQVSDAMDELQELLEFSPEEDLDFQ